MLTINELLKYSNLNLTANEILVLHILKSIPQPIRLFNILNICGCNIKERQLRNIFLNLQNLNFFIRFRLKNGFIFAFPFIKIFDKKYKKLKQIPTGNVLPIITGNRLPVINNQNNQPAMRCRIGYLYNIYNKYKRSFNVISKNNLNNKYIKEEEFTLYNIKNKHKEHYDNTLCNTIKNKQSDNTRKFVVNKNNYLSIKSIKERFKIDFPEKNSYINCALPDNFSYSLLKEKIEKSDFLKQNNKLGFNWILTNYDKIIHDFYENKTNNFVANKQNESICDFSQRTYTKEFCENLYDNLNDIGV